MVKEQIIYDKRKAMGESIRAMRTAQGWEQEQLAQIAGITAANVRSIEAGKYAVNIDVLNKIAVALNAELRMIERSKNMEKDYIKQLIRESATKVCQTLNALQAIERRFNDDLVDDNGKNVEAEYYALRNAIASLKSAYEDIKDI